MTFVVVGGGPTGVELAGALGEIAHDTLKRDFRAIRTRTPGSSSSRRSTGSCRPIPRIARPRRASNWSALARPCAPRRGSSTSTNAVRVVTDGVEETIPTRTVLWAAGVAASSFAQTVARATGAGTDRAGASSSGRT